MGLIADIFDALIIGTDGEVIASTTLQTANIGVEVGETEVRGGKSNALISILHGQMDINLELEDVTFNPNWLARSLGQSIVVGANVAYAAPKWYTATGATPKITLDTPPLATGHELSIYKADGTKVTTFTVSGSDVTFSTGIIANEKVEVRTYKFNTPATTQTIKIDTATFPKAVKVVLETIELNNEEQAIAKLQYQFDRALPSASFTVNTTAERSASAQQMNLRVIKPVDTTEMGRLVRIPLV